MVIKSLNSCSGAVALHKSPQNRPKVPYFGQNPQPAPAPAPVMDPNFLLVLNPQGALGQKLSAHMNKPGTSCFGGQLIWTTEFARAAAALPIQQPRRQPSLQKFRVEVASQQIVDDVRFNNDFAATQEKVGKAKIVRFPLSPDSKYIDKEQTQGGVNQYYPKVMNWGQKVADHYINEGKVPGMVMGGYWDSYIGYSNMFARFKEKGIKEKPKVVMVPHSLGYRKLKSLIKAEKPYSKADLCQKATKLMDDAKYEFPLRIMTERLMFADPNTLGGFNSQTEIQEQLLTGPYILDGKYPKVTDRGLKAISAGVDVPLFSLANTKNEDIVGQRIKKAINRDISPERKGKTLIIALGRLNHDKNFHSLVEAFKQSSELQEKANLAFIINVNGAEDESINAIKTYQENPNAPVLSGFQGSTRDQLHKMAELLNDNNLNGKWTAFSAGNREDFAAVQRYLGRNAGEQGGRKVVSGLFSFKEPYGLLPFESSLAGIPVVVSSGSGAAPELKAHGAESFDPNKPEEIANALLKTIDNDGTYRQKRDSLMNYAGTKSWSNTASKYIGHLKTGSNVVSLQKSAPVINLETLPALKKEGKRLILEALRQDKDFRAL